jgi:hypothetical protein
MKKLALLVAAVLTSGLSFAQMQTPQPSPSEKITTMVGLTEVTIEYSRPSARGREIFGNLVPYGKVWRTGANANTKITFGDAVTVGDQTLKAGTYALYSKPGEKTWDIIFYADANNWGTPRKWDDSKVAAMINVPATKMPDPIKVETFSIMLDELTNNGAHIGIMWADVYIGVPFGVPTAEKAQKSIEGVMAGPSANDYFSAASYYYQEGLDMEKAKMWVDKAVDLREEAFWMSRLQSLIYAKMGNKKGAIKAAKNSLAKAKEAGNADYVKMNEDSLKEWGAK